MLCSSSQLLGREQQKSFPMNLNLLLETLSFIEMGKMVMNSFTGR